MCVRCVIAILNEESHGPVPVERKPVRQVNEHLDSIDNISCRHLLNTLLPYCAMVGVTQIHAWSSARVAVTCHELQIPKWRDTSLPQHQVMQQQRIPTRQDLTQWLWEEIGQPHTTISILLSGGTKPQGTNHNYKGGWDWSSDSILVSPPVYVTFSHSLPSQN